MIFYASSNRTDPAEFQFGVKPRIEHGGSSWAPSVSYGLSCDPHSVAEIATTKQRVATTNCDICLDEFVEEVKTVALEYKGIHANKHCLGSS